MYLGSERCVLGEGPTYDRHRDTAWWFDILGKVLFEHRFADGLTRRHDLPEFSSAVARVDDERQLLVTESGLYLRNIVDGSLRLHCPMEEDNPRTRSNDSRVHPSGAFWIGTMGKNAEKDAGSIYWYRGGEVRRLFSGITVTNAICFSPDGRVGYFTDTPTLQIMQVQLDPDTGLPVGEPSAFAIPSSDGDPDGAVVDAEGNLWVARWGGHGVEVYSPQGDLLRKIELPAALITCPAFVGPNADRLLVTSASIDVEPDSPGSEFAGSVFLVDLGAPTGKLEPDVVIA
ncbi:SMP-30/gluconolactonase/LRE family protein [Nitratireductor kimnyeongensis]|nr:SMP-30/gluconolactonase/LRE family protein [Nitratireductor kimnyeongensis]QZZ37324.1 SMP-30/gluconolactonase/LRE family protein [Nitratireductor kimnyeongensis]